MVGAVNVAGRLRACVALALLAALALAWGVVLAHTHANGSFHENCPACHQERVVSDQPASAHAALLELTPVFQGLPAAAPSDNRLLDPELAGWSPRGPPLPL